MQDECDSDGSIIDIDDAPSPPPAPPPNSKSRNRTQRPRLKPPSTRAILELGDRDFRRPPAPVVKCHVLGVAVLRDLLKASFEHAVH